MSQDVEKHRKWIRNSERGRSTVLYNLGKALIIKQIEEMGRSTGKVMRKAVEGQGLNNSFRNYFIESDSGNSVYDFAWTRSIKKSNDAERVVEFSYCPIAEGYKSLGEEAVKIGELFCNHIDNAIIQGYNPDYECKRESSLNLNGLCRLHWKKIQ
jgi:L-2-amino-thiazoline-4-carboxylic acid hydrolase